jgi:hypothetical protein
VYNLLNGCDIIEQVAPDILSGHLIALVNFVKSMSERQAKTMKNPELQTKFTVGQIVNIPLRVAYRLTSKTAALRRPFLGRVLSLGNRQVGQHYRFAVDIDCLLGPVEVWEEWQLNAIHPATADQIARHAECSYLKPPPENPAANPA